jgi:Fic family protein
MHEALNAFEEYLHKKGIYPPLVRLALIHYQFEAIHPFLDGNGRVGRLLLSLLLVEWELLPLPLLYLSAFFYGHRQQYYDNLTAVSERGAWNEWLFYFLRGVTEQALDAIERAKELQDLQIAWRERLTQDRASILLLRLADHLFITPVITIPEAQRVLEVSYPTAQRYVQKLIEMGVLGQLGESEYNKTFIAHEILDVVETRVRRDED